MEKWRIVGDTVTASASTDITLFDVLELLTDIGIPELILE